MTASGVEPPRLQSEAETSARDRDTGARPWWRRWWFGMTLAWFATRLLLLLFDTKIVPYRWHHSATSDVPIYHHWSWVLQQGRFPADDTRWQYPPGAAGIMLLPDLVPGGWPAYLNTFFAIVLVFDAIAFWLLMRQVPRGGSVQGPWLWTLGVFLLGPITLGRYDLIVATIAMAALLLAGRPLVRGALIGVGTMIKVWPVVLLAGVRRWRELIVTTLGATVVIAATTLAIGATLPGSSSFLRFQKERGIQIESVAATPFLIGRSLGWPGRTGDRYGAREAIGPGVDFAIAACGVATVVGGLVLLAWWVRARWTETTPYDAALFATLLGMITSRVLSPQYMLWALGLGAVCVTFAKTSQRPVAWLLLLATALTQLEFPILWGGVVHNDLGGMAALTARNVLLVGATVWSGIRLWKATGERAVEAV